MSDLSRTDGSRAIDAASDPDRDAKIEHLLIAGLDHYFAGRYEHAINVWTRALFFDRGHSRARAYIERARRALAERQRESDELLHDGVAALDRGEGGEARRLLQAAIDSGAPVDELHPLIGRLNRESDAGGDEGAGSRVRPAASPAASGPPRATRFAAHERKAGGRPGFVLLATTMVATVLAIAYGLAVRDGLALRSILSFQEPPVAATAVPTSRDATLPLPRRGELALARARSLTASGHLHEALTALDSVRPTDPQDADAARLRSEIQRQLLGLAVLAPSSTVGADKENDAGRQR